MLQLFGLLAQEKKQLMQWSRKQKLGRNYQAMFVRTLVDQGNVGVKAEKKRKIHFMLVKFCYLSLYLAKAMNLMPILLFGHFRPCTFQILKFQSSPNNNR